VCFNLNLLLLILSKPFHCTRLNLTVNYYLPFLLTLCLSFNCTTCNTTVWIQLLNVVQELSDFPTFFNFFVKSTTFSVGKNATFLRKSQLFRYKYNLLDWWETPKKQYLLLLTNQPNQPNELNQNQKSTGLGSRM